MKKSADAIEMADKDKNLSDPTYLGELQSIVVRLNQIISGIKSDNEAASVQGLADGFAKILDEQTNNQPISLETGKSFATAAKNFGAACITALTQN